MASSGRSVEDQAWVTLATNDTYALGALVLAHSLIQVGTTRKLVVLVTPGVSAPMRSHLGSVFDLVKEVNVLDSSDTENLALLSRPDLGITFTKLHCWRLTQFKRCVFMDADTLVLQNCDELFDREELSAAPDVGWPDCFNSGVFVYHPSDETYRSLIQFALTTGSFDGGDQGLLNLFFHDWATKDIAKHLPFIYNMTSSVAYTYQPAYQHFAKDVKVVHFIGPVKPWHHHCNTATGTVESHPAAFHSLSHLQSWWNIFVSDVKPNLQDELTVETKHVQEQMKQAGLAGYLSQLSLGEAQTSEQKTLEDRARQFAWEQGQIDFMGADSFDNIQKKLDASLASTDVVTTTPPTDAAAEAEKSTAPSESETPKEAVVASVVSDQSSITQPSDAPVLTSPIAVSSSAVGATVSSVLPDSSKAGDIKPPSLAVAIPPAPIVPIIPSPPIPLPPPPSTPPVVPATPPTPPIPLHPGTAATAASGTLPVASTVPGTPPIVPAAPVAPPVVSGAPSTPSVVPAAVPGTPPVATATPVTPPVAPVTPPGVPATPVTPPVVPAAPVTPPVVPAAPVTPPVVPAAPVTPPVVPAAPVTPPVVPAAPVTPSVASAPAIPKCSAKPTAPGTPPVTAETPAPPIPPRVPTTPPVTSAVPSIPTPAAPQTKVASTPKGTTADVPVGASPAQVVEPGAPATPPAAVAGADAAAEEGVPKTVGGKKSTKQTPSAPVRKGEKGKPSKK